MGEVGHRFGDELLGSWRGLETLLGVWESLLVIFIKSGRPHRAPSTSQLCSSQIKSMCIRNRVRSS